MPAEIVAITVAGINGKLALANLLKEANLTASTSESHRMVDQGAVKIDGEKVTDSRLEVAAGSSHVYQVGKRRFAKVTVK